MNPIRRDLHPLSLLAVLLATAAAIGSSGCAGPVTPLGAVWAVTPEQARKLDALEEAKNDAFSMPRSIAAEPTVKIRFTPERQILHGPSPLKIIIEDSVGNFSDYELMVRYNGLDVSRTFLQRANVMVDPARHRIQIEHPRVDLAAGSDHAIEFAYRSSTGSLTVARYEAPVCYAFRAQSVNDLGDFSSNYQLARMIEKISLEKGVNPSFAVALVAQESGFNPRAVSWAKAVGLTQVTPSAEEEVLSQFENWPRYPGLNNHSFPVLKALVLSGRVNSVNEWRLNKEQSVIGGLTYAIQIAKKWSTPEALAKIRGMFRDPELAHTELVLASYHSGYARVAAAFEKNGRAWLSQPDLREARKYVRRILSYCQSFTNKKETDLAHAS